MSDPSRGAPWPGLGWERLAQAVAEVLPPAEVDGVWAFSPLRRESKEWGTAVLFLVECDRRLIYTARYELAIKGKERGKIAAYVQEVGSGPLHALNRLVQEAQRRIDDEHPPISIPPGSWFPAVVPVDLGVDGQPR